MRVHKNVLASLGFVALAAAAAPAMATPITYSETVTGNGLIAGLGFHNAIVKLTLSSDTADVVTGGPGFFINFGTATVSVAGLTRTFSDPTEVFDNQATGAAGFKDVMSVDILNTQNAAFSTYDLTTAIGPVVGTALFNSAHLFATTDGFGFALDSVAEKAIFSATLGVTRGVPEPVSLLILGFALAGFGVIGRRKIFIGF